MTYTIQTRLDGRLGEWFTLDELRRNGQGLTNYPPAAALTNMTILVQHFLDPLREAIGKPVRVTSGYRCKALNEAVGGSKTSAHLTGEAADIKVQGMDSAAIARLIMELGLPEQPLLDIPVPSGRVGAIIVGGLNPIAVLEERDHPIFSRALSGLVEYDRLFRFEEFPRRLQSFL